MIHEVGALECPLSPAPWSGMASSVSPSCLPHGDLKTTPRNVTGHLTVPGEVLLGLCSASGPASFSVKFPRVLAPELCPCSRPVISLPPCFPHSPLGGELPGLVSSRVLQPATISLEPVDSRVLRRRGSPFFCHQVLTGFHEAGCGHSHAWPVPSSPWERGSGIMEEKSPLSYECLLTSPPRQRHLQLRAFTFYEFLQLSSTTYYLFLGRERKEAGSLPMSGGGGK